MRLGVSLGLVLLASSEANLAKEFSADGAYRDVERSCRIDVELMCMPNMEFPIMTMLSSEPMLFFSVSESYTPMHDMDRAMDEMLNSIFGLHASTSLVAQNKDEEPSTSSHADVEPQLSVEVKELDEVFEIPKLAHELKKHTESLVSDMGLRSDKYQAVARRLTQTDSKPVVNLPFRCRNQCLWSAFQKQMVSDKCSRSIWMLQSVHAMEAAMEAELNSRNEEFVSRVMVYISAVAALAIVFSRCLRRSGRSAKLNAKAIDAVRNNPEIRRHVELYICESVECQGYSKGPGDKQNKTTAVDQDKNMLPKTTIVCEGVPVQIV
jgi:hypothetical protein